MESARLEPIPPADDLDPGISLKPVLKALEEVQYPGLVQLHVWHFPLRENIDASAASLVRVSYLRIYLHYIEHMCIMNDQSTWIHACTCVHTHKHTHNEF